MRAEYPVQFSVDYGDGSRNRLTSLFRWVLMIPIVVVAYAFSLVTDRYPPFRLSP